MSDDVPDPDVTEPRAPAESELGEGVTRFGHYILKRLLGSGGMGQVYEAEDTVMDRVVALKLISGPSAQDPDFRKRLQREARIAGRLQEPHVVPIHGTGEVDGQLYVDMRLINGTDLHTVLSRGALKPRRAVVIVAQIAAALDAAHAAGVMHRDVKPGNILVTDTDFAYLVDFGIANAVTEEKLTQAGEFIGTLAYMAPERFVGDNDKITPSADTYALACVLYELLTGAPPFDGDQLSLIGAHLTQPPPRPTSTRPDVPSGFDDVIAKGMAKRPEDRYRSAGELAHAAADALSAGAKPVDGAEHKTIRIPQEPYRSAPPRPLPPTVYPPPRHPHGAYPSHPSTPRPYGPPPMQPSGPIHPPARTRRRVWPFAVAAAVVVIVAAAIGFGVWGLTRQGPAADNVATSTTTSTGTTTTSTAPLDALNSTELNLLKVMPLVGYNRDNCERQTPSAGADAHFTCEPNPVVGSPFAQFHHYPSPDAAREAYDRHRAIFGGTNCPGDPAGEDGPWKVDGKEVGRQACYLDKSADPPAPSTVIMHADHGVIEVLNWTGPGGFEALSNVWKQGLAKLQRAPGQDPDNFTQKDRDLLARLGSDDYTTANCRHLDPPAPAQAGLICAYNLQTGAPQSNFLLFASADDATRWYDNLAAIAGPHRCVGQPGADDPWIRRGERVGKYSCFDDKSLDNRPAVLAVATEGRYLSAEFIAAPTDSPFANLPKTEQAVTDWFKTKFNA